jgi:nucleotide-binding universal stress UspA family protein
MKKVLVAFDGSHFSEGALEFARQLNTRNPLLLIGAFLPQINYSALWSLSGGGKAGSVFIPLLEDDDAVAVQENMLRFAEYCQRNKIEYRVHKDFLNFALPELKNEARFADLLILGSERFYEEAGTTKPNEYLKEALYGVECPVIVIPEKFDFPQHNILTYDGKESSVYAIKQFAYLFPELAANDTILVYADKKGKDKLPDQSNIEELAARHFSNLTLCDLEMNSRTHFAEWLSGRKAAIIVTGSFGSTSFAQLFHKSFAADIIAEHNMPVFIAHK